MSKKKVSLISKPSKARSFTQLLITTYSFLFFTIGFLLLFFTKEISLLSINGAQVKATVVVEQFFGSFMILLSLLMFNVRKIEGKIIFNCILALIIVGFINLHLLFVLGDSITLSSIYFIFQILMQLSFFVILIEQYKIK